MPRFGLERRTDAALVALAQSGSEGAYEEILRRYGRQLHAYCSQMLGASRAEDAVQQAFLQAFVALRRGSDREINLRPWLYRISHNCAIDMLRKNGWDYDQLDPEYDGVAQPPQLFEQKEELSKVVGAMRALPDRQRRALTLRELEGRSYSEIGAELGHSDAGVRQLIFRARSALRGAAGALVLPFGAVRMRLSQHVSQLTDSHQAAFAASVGGEPAGAGLAKASAVFVAGLSLLTTGAPAKAGHATPTGGSAPSAIVGGGLAGTVPLDTTYGGGGPAARHTSLGGAVHVAAPGEQPTVVSPTAASQAPAPPGTVPAASSPPEAQAQNAAPQDRPVGGGSDKTSGGHESGKEKQSGKTGSGRGGSGQSGSGKAQGGTPGSSAQPIVGRPAPNPGAAKTKKISSGGSPSRQTVIKRQVSAPAQPARKLSAPKSAPKLMGASTPPSSSGSARNKPVGNPNPAPQTGSPGPARGQNPTKETGHVKGPSSGKGSPASGR